MHGEKIKFKISKITGGENMAYVEVEKLFPVETIFLGT
jgi:hypothetical protein